MKNFKEYKSVYKEAKFESIGPLDVLPKGTEVIVSGKYGNVIGSRKVEAHPSGFIVVHKIKFYKQTAGKKPTKDGMVRTYKNINKTGDVNYSFIIVVK